MRSQLPDLLDFCTLIDCSTGGDVDAAIERLRKEIEKEQRCAIEVFAIDAVSHHGGSYKRVTWKRGDPKFPIKFTKGLRP